VVKVTVQNAHAAIEWIAIKVVCLSHVFTALVLDSAVIHPGNEATVLGKWLRSAADALAPIAQRGT
jgi:hypothetical protein